MEYIFGIHEAGGERWMLEAQHPGWIVLTEALGTDVNDRSGRDYRQWSEAELGVIARLNNGYFPVGTIPQPEEYADFAQRCANFVAGSRGCTRWIIGNEMNHEQERPYRMPITPAEYARCYRLCREAIHKVQPEAEVLIGAVAPWNVQTKYASNWSGDWIVYFSDILELVGECDGITLHTYTHGADPKLVLSEATMDPPFDAYHYHFRAYRDFMDEIPESMQHLPVYITETDQDVAWVDENKGWIQVAYAEIDSWNCTPGNQQIRALCLYRWPKIDKWYIEGKSGVIKDFRAALRHEYRWSQNATEGKFQVGDSIRATTQVNVRAGAGMDQPIVGWLKSGIQTQVVGGPARASGLTWWQVEMSGRTGWAAEAVGELELLELLDVALPPSLPQSGGGADAWTRAIQFVLRWEGGYVNHPQDPGGETNFGITKRSYPQLDIKNLTETEARQIYWQDYWLGSGAHELAWPLALAHFDLAVNAGKGRAGQFLRESQGDFERYMSLRLDWYTRIDNFEHFGRGWVRRCADLMRVASE